MLSFLYPTLNTPSVPRDILQTPFNQITRVLHIFGSLPILYATLSVDLFFEFYLLKKGSKGVVFYSLESRTGTSCTHTHKRGEIRRRSRKDGRYIRIYPVNVVTVC